MTSRSVTWGRNVLLANHYSPAPTVARADDDDDDCDDSDYNEQHEPASAAPYPCSTDDII